MTTTPPIPDGTDTAYDPDAYLARLPIGVPQELPAGSAPTWETFPFDGTLRVKALEPPVFPEPPRHGEDGPEDCAGCTSPVEDALWADDHPAGMQQLRGSFLPAWEGVLPRMPGEQRRAAHLHIATALAADGGKAYAK
ncbi:hypothetical protein ACFYVL_24495 [Streptomyces sp. NPDC004111]|uniref:hypothetical protein n=1 Tax=Streptomyces sp. NPDC004111 TaxID=3364690 RepID=UPI0036A9C160